MGNVDLKNLSLQEMENLISQLGERSYRAYQIFEWVFQKDAGDIREMTNLPLKFRNSLSELACTKRLPITDKRVSKDGTRKYLFVLEDGNTIENVLIPDEEKRTLCISTQVGCKLNCSFCLTGKGGFVRNLKTSEIIEQVLSICREIQENITNIVFMGMGEPLDNYENVIKTIKIMISPHGLKIPARRITLSTAGIVPGIIRLAGENLKINLAVSLNTADNETRDGIMPVNKKYPIDKLLEALKEYPLPPGRRITFEYVMMKGINDTIEDAKRLLKILKGIRCKINLIPFNKIEGSNLEPSHPESIEEFQNLLVSKHYTVIIRKSKGADIWAACGQLRSSKMTIKD
ncbi:MAG: 23S rRNA (adenine(2503)-C(2))-methyltransferase [Nitrospinae bacterium RIFCSPLOWO2_02_FULL_39_110]|nr:MAG: 23S rRNA (adenine(2503)-C(2))-methyltransferase [Nitrospinae bacterium RIFCSPHIGHO2_02_39_11]OGV99454.1 MAG: 23S rRNA (adenine(2503)-C(2))-methyltransferase [Nitrospinae bacterium RIFCSPHIGHO2_12_FULL_39_42]OGW01420.1 MAG: 23S rRNA (adenine(2503)-C(2))-methyltransferase [Nitrospinae bacterium RIFCSPHIGHO2_02_FULL_39_82]OGW06844.1 MAG: 23S rRNA (adenine(2503)-C(2))-methyltransferase [Nitrospinae bacterium RIFCSPLOWO2_02_FULL_39_110]OGW06961.1 MAG: 23S rRNA (adenine(2503)-C(2))-methyltran